MGNADMSFKVASVRCGRRKTLSRDPPYCKNSFFRSVEHGARSGALRGALCLPFRMYPCLNPRRTSLLWQT